VNTELKMPSRVNRVSPFDYHFPEIIGLCDRKDDSHSQSSEEESYGYFLNGRLIYRLIGNGLRYELTTYQNEEEIGVTTGTGLEHVLYSAFLVPSKDPQFVNILVSLKKDDSDRLLFLMYILGGYMGSFLSTTTELLIVIQHFVNPLLKFMCFHRIPKEYVPWLAEELQSEGILCPEENRKIIVF